MNNQIGWKRSYLSYHLVNIRDIGSLNHVTSYAVSSDLLCCENISQEEHVVLIRFFFGLYDLTLNAEDSNFII